jgi:hypothetical protein
VVALQLKVARNARIASEDPKYRFHIWEGEKIQVLIWEEKGYVRESDHVNRDAHVGCGWVRLKAADRLLTS